VHPIDSTQHSKAPRTVVAVVNDLMFGSRIRAAAQIANVNTQFVRSADALAEAAAGADLILLDLETRWLDAPVSIAALKAAAATASIPIVAFGSHVDGAALVAARDAGADRALARSAFVRVLPDLMRG
jgi:CheY-like chemotaxis protein